jgi:hypothetical protein
LSISSSSRHEEQISGGQYPSEEVSSAGESLVERVSPSPRRTATWSP